MREGDRVWIPRSSGKVSPGVIEEVYPNGWAKVKLDVKGRRGQDIGKNVPLDELRRI
jgi:hypothetical protein